MLALKRIGFATEEVYDMPLDVFRAYTGTHSRLEAMRRLEYISDTMAAVAALFGPSDSIKDHTAALEAAYRG